MADAISITVDEAQLDRLKRDLAGIRGGVPKAISSAINKTLPQGRTVIVKGLADVLTAKRGNIGGRVKVKKASIKNLVGIITIQGRRIGLINFAAKDLGRGKGRKRTGRGVSTQIYKSGSPEIFRYAFIAHGKKSVTNPLGNRQVFERFVKDGKRVGRLPLFSHKGVSLMDVYKKLPGLEAAAIAKVRGIFNEKLLSQTDWLLNRSKGERPE